MPNKPFPESQTHYTEESQNSFTGPADETLRRDRRQRR